MSASDLATFVGNSWALASVCPWTGRPSGTAWATTTTGGCRFPAPSPFPTGCCLFVTAAPSSPGLPPRSGGTGTLRRTSWWSGCRYSRRRACAFDVDPGTHVSITRSCSSLVPSTFSQVPRAGGGSITSHLPAVSATRSLAARCGCRRKGPRGVPHRGAIGPRWSPHGSCCFAAPIAGQYMSHDGRGLRSAAVTTGCYGLDGAAA
jgi:hypothetical protein